MEEQIIVVDDDQEASLAKIRAEQINAVEKLQDLKDTKYSPSLFDVDERRSLSSSPAADSKSALSDNAMPSRGRTKVDPSIRKLPCVICGCPANGYHFGALSCAACNAFFRRSVAESRKYFCRKNGRCVIDQAARCFCRACRLKKCLEKGMDPNAVQPHRDMIGQKRKRHFDEARRDCPNSALTVAIDSVCEVRPTFKKLPVTALMDAEDVSSGEAKKKVPFRNVIAEQLLAFSRTPLIASATDGIPLRSNSHGGATQNVLRDCEQHESISEPSSVNPATGVTAFEGSLERSHSSNSAPHITQHTEMSSVGSVEHEVQYVPYEEFHHGLEHEEIVEQYTEVPSTSGVWVYENDLNHNAKQQVQETPTAAEQRIKQMPAHNNGQPNSAYDANVNLIDQLVDSYRRLRERRRLLHCPGTIRDILGGTEPPLRPAELGEHCDSKLRTEVGLVTEFINSIHPFSKLRLDDRILLFKKASIPYSIMEKHYITMRGGGYQANRIINCDNSFHDLSPGSEKSVQEKNGGETGEEKTKMGTRSKTKAAVDSPMKVDTDTVKRLLLPFLRESLRDITGPMYHFGMTDVEFVALTVVIIFDHTVPGLSEVTRRLVKEARDRMFRDWLAYYEAHGITDGPQRVGNAMLILPAIQVTCDKQVENYHLVRLFGFFELDKIVDEVMH